MRKINLGIIGCGIAARELHLPALKKLKDKFQITVVCNHTEKKAKDFSKITGNIPYVLDYRDVLKRNDVEAVDIALPIYLNYRVTKDTLKAGKHVIVEKPLAGNLSEAKKMVDLQDRYPLVTMVAENFRYKQIFHRVKTYMKQGKIGICYAVLWDALHHMNLESKYAQTKWRVHHKHIGGFITDGGVHFTAAIRFLFGEIISGAAFTDSIHKEIGKLDTLSFQFRTNNGINGVLNMFYSANGIAVHRLTILGNEGSLIIEGNRILFKRTGKPDIEENIKDDGGYTAEFENFYNAITKGQKIISSFSEGYQDLKQIIEVINSAKIRNH